MKRKWLVISVLIVVLLCTLAYLFLFSTSGAYYRTYSPDQQYSVYASRYYYEQFMPRMPGQSGDAAGKIFLYDEVEKKIIGKASIPILWMTEEIIWENDKAYFKGVDFPHAGDPWKLPRPIKDTRLYDPNENHGSNIPIYPVLDSLQKSGNIELLSRINTNDEDFTFSNKSAMEYLPKLYPNYKYQ